MQQFEVTLKVTMNTIDTLSPKEVKEHVQEYMEDYNGGPVEVVEVKEI